MFSLSSHAGGRHIDTETISRRYRGIDSWEAADVLQALWQSQLAAVARVAGALDSIENAAAASAVVLARGGRLCCAGAGTSARLAAQELAELEPTFGWPAKRALVLIAGGEVARMASVEDAEDDAQAARAAVAAHGVGAGDVLIGLAASGRTPYTVAAVTAARDHGALTIGVACVTEAPLLRAAAHPVVTETGAEPVAGSTRLGAGTAQKVVLNLFSTLLMIRLGHVHDGMMVDMRPRNAKLRQRAQSMLARITDADPEDADAALARADFNVKRAALLLRGLTPEAADALLARHGGHLRAALEALPP